MPLEIDGLMVFYNKQLLASAGVTTPPTDWDSFTDLAHKLTVKNGSGQITQSGLAMGTANNISHSAEIVSYLLLEQGIDLIDDSRTTVTLNTKAVQDVFDTYTSFAMGSDATWSSTLGTDLTMFEQGKLAMLIAPSWRAFDIIQAAPSIEFGMSTLPQLAANNNPVYFATYWGEAVNKNTKNPTAAWAFINFLAQKEQEQTMFSNESKIRAFGEPYSRVDLNSALQSQTYTSAIATSAPEMVSWQMGDESFVKASLNEAITSIAENGQDTQSALTTAQTEINTDLAQTNK
jgi:multiple sugar transport system substrate-binding protein